MCCTFIVLLGTEIAFTLLYILSLTPHAVGGADPLGALRRV